MLTRWHARSRCADCAVGACGQVRSRVKSNACWFVYSFTEMTRVLRESLAPAGADAAAGAMAHTPAATLGGGHVAPLD